MRSQWEVRYQPRGELVIARIGHLGVAYHGKADHIGVAERAVAIPGGVVVHNTRPAMTAGVPRAGAHLSGYFRISDDNSTRLNRKRERGPSATKDPKWQPKLGSALALVLGEGKLKMLPNHKYAKSQYDISVAEVSSDLSKHLQKEVSGLEKEFYAAPCSSRAGKKGESNGSSFLATPPRTPVQEAGPTRSTIDAHRNEPKWQTKLISALAVVIEDAATIQRVDSRQD
uniref:Uncharacterized protein n=1 Tax=Branchiostoma floridae TaxID=7739 RepID=C3Y9Q6_BRAFL|eukprot:XP_002607302.1 hypothetical protein BRAFLDRAFT_88252 [Branchiostoma floridae]